MDILVVTGGIGSGKSEVCRILQKEFGCGLYNADQSVKRLYDTHPTLLEGIEEVTGTILRDDKGRFVPSRLSQKIFSDKELLLKVEDLVFPALTEDFMSWSQKYAGDRFIVFESATILEKPLLSGFGDKVILVDAPMRIRLERACSRDSSTSEAVSRRMMNQKMMNDISEGRIRPQADAVIHNVGSLDDLREATLSVIDNFYGNI